MSEASAAATVYQDLLISCWNCVPSQSFKSL